MIDLTKCLDGLSWCYGHYKAYKVCKCGVFMPATWVDRVCPECGGEDWTRRIIKIIPGKSVFSKSKGATFVVKP